MYVSLTTNYKKLRSGYREFDTRRFAPRCRTWSIVFVKFLYNQKMIPREILNIFVQKYALRKKCQNLLIFSDFNKEKLRILVK